MVSGQLVYGSLNTFHAQVTLNGTTPVLLADVRSTRRRVTFKNIDTVLTIWISEATVSSTKGMELHPGESRDYYAIGALWAVTTAGAPIVCVSEEYD